jgi:hypothetical protein
MAMEDVQTPDAAAWEFPVVGITWKPTSAPG